MKRVPFGETRYARIFEDAERLPRFIQAETRGKSSPSDA